LYSLVPADLPSEITKPVFTSELDIPIPKKEPSSKKKLAEKQAPSISSTIEQKSMFDFPPVGKAKNKLDVDLNLPASAPKKQFENNILPDAPHAKEEERVSVGVKVEIQARVYYQGNDREAEEADRRSRSKSALC
jgi:hypothetical protein